MTRILLAGASGYLGSYIAKELQNRKYFVRIVARNAKKLIKNNIFAKEIIEAEVTQAKSLNGCCESIDVVISTVGITRQKDGLTYMDVDYQANMNLLNEAIRSGVKKFIYISALNADIFRHLKICEAKEKFVDTLKESGIEYCVIRPHGFFSDMSEFYKMAKSGRVYVFGNGEQRGNPIHGEDCAEVCIDAIDQSNKEIKVGGPEVLTHNEIGNTAFKVIAKKPKITHIPNWIRVLILKTVRIFTSSKVYGPIEFFLTVAATDMVAPQYGKHTLENLFIELNRAER